MANIAGIFNSASEANNGYSKLKDAGVSAEKISLVISKEGHDRVFTGITTTEQGAHDAIKGGILGAVGVGTLSALVGGLTALVTGPGILAAGPLLIVLSSAGAGALVGGLSGALVEAGFSRDEAGEYSEALEAGKIVLIVHDVDSNQEQRIRNIMRSEGAATEYAA